jgi:hypothetical protein
MKILLLLYSLLIVIETQAQIHSGGPLGDLHLAREGKLIQYSSADPTGGNSDRRPIEPGETLTLVDHKGAGVIRRWWITIAPRNSVEIHRTLIVRCYWDDEDQPSVEVPVADFFGMGFGEWKDFISLPLNMTSGGYNAYWPMPFMESARVEVVNTGNVPIESFYYNIDIRTYHKPPEDALYFHAQFRKTRTKTGQPVTILETTGRGHYVGTLMSMQPERGKHLGYLEGDEFIFVDGEQDPSIIGTGTEDYFSSGWYYITGEYAAPYHGVTIKDTDNGRINTYRWHIEDPIPFERSLKFIIEHGGTNDMPNVEYSSVAFWYQTHPHPPFPALPESLIPLSSVSKPQIEGEALMEGAEVTGGHLEVQNMENFNGDWSNDEHLWWINGRPDDRLTLLLEADEAGEYELVGFFTRAPDYGVFRIIINGKAQGNLFDGYHPDVATSGPVSFGMVSLNQGSNEVVIEIIGKDVRAAGFGDGYLVGIDGFLLYK